MEELNYNDEEGFDDESEKKSAKVYVAMHTFTSIFDIFDTSIHFDLISPTTK